MTKQIDLYIDYKSPFAYLSIEPSMVLERDFDVEINWLPYTLNIAEYRGSARVNDQKEVIEDNRTERQWRRVKYAYMDARRYANLRGLTVRGTQKIWDSRIAGVGLLYAKRQRVVSAYNAIVYDRFWKRELDIEDPAVVRDVLTEAGADAGDFLEFLDSDGMAEHDRIRAAAEERGVFGVPSYILDDELFWGREHLSLIRMRLADQGLAKPGVEPPYDVPVAFR